MRQILLSYLICTDLKVSSILAREKKTNNRQTKIGVVLIILISLLKSLLVTGSWEGPGSRISSSSGSGVSWAIIFGRSGEDLETIEERSSDDSLLSSSSSSRLLQVKNNLVMLGRDLERVWWRGVLASGRLSVDLLFRPRDWRKAGTSGVDDWKFKMCKVRYNTKRKVNKYPQLSWVDIEQHSKNQQGLVRLKIIEFKIKKKWVHILYRFSKYYKCCKFKKKFISTKTITLRFWINKTR